MLSVIFDDKKIYNNSIKQNTSRKGVVIQLPDKDENHLAFIACHHEQLFSLFDADNDRETSHFLEEISNFEAEILYECFALDQDLEKSFGGWTGELIITGANSEIIHHEKPA